MYRDNSMLQKFTSKNLEFIIERQKKCAEIKILRDINRKFYVFVSLARFIRKRTILNQIPYLGTDNVSFVIGQLGKDFLLREDFKTVVPVEPTI